MGAFAEHGDASSWAPWLRLVRFWPKPEPLFAEPLSRMVQRARAEPGVPDTTVRLLRQNIAYMEKQAARSRRRRR
ncbi:MAG: hypothetical protein IAG13_27385 [Deltaproteobacteria bacterium]|nr:hypothetical protein [Nannocystaceae bacterium]